MAKIVKLIFTKERIWTWKEWDPVRKKYQLFTEDWELICEHDPENIYPWTVGMEKLSE